MKQADLNFRHGPFRRWRRDNPFLALTVCLFVILLALPFVADSLGGYLLFELLYLNVILLGISGSGLVKKSTKKLLVALWLIGVLFTVPDYTSITWLAQFWSNQAGSLVHITILFICLFHLFRHVVSAKLVVAETLFAAISAYLFLALVWSQIFIILEKFSPGSFLLTNGGEGLQLLEILYFSLTTITTLGYGDVVALTPFARMLTVCEALTGQLFLTVLVAWVVGMFLTSKRREKD